MLRVYASLLTGLHLPAISDVEFGHMRGGGGGGGGGPAPALEVPTAEGGTVTVASGAVLAAVGTRNAVRIHFSERSPAARLLGRQIASRGSRARSCLVRPPKATMPRGTRATTA